MKRFLCAGAMLSALAVTVTAPNWAQAQTISEELLDKAQAEETVRVIVRLETPFTPMEMIEEGTADRAAEAIETVQANFIEGLDGVAYADPIAGLPLAVLEVTAEQLAALADNPAVAVVVEDELAAPTLADSIPLTEANAAHTAGFNGTGHTVAILDTGVDTGHAAFAGKIVSEACYSTTSSANGGSTSFCPGGAAESTAAGAGADCPTSVSGCGHGTHVAGISAGNGSGVVGVAPGASIIPVKVFSQFNSAATCSPRPAPCALSYTSDQIKGLNRVRTLAQTTTLKIASANMSLGGGMFTSACDTDSRKAVIDQLVALGVATVIASGNDGFTNAVGAPGCVSTAVTVGSTTKSDALSSFSNHATLVDLLAPGSNIVSARSGGGTVSFSGTSMATPHVAGAFALHRSRFPADSVSTIESKLKAEGKSVTSSGIAKPRIDLGYLGGAIIIPVPVGATPLAGGTVWMNGAKQQGWGTWTSTFNPTYTRYEIDISGESYYYLNYVTQITAMDVRYCKSSSVSGKLLVYCYDHDGNPATARFAFVTYKP